MDIGAILLHTGTSMLFSLSQYVVFSMLLNSNTQAHQGKPFVQPPLGKAEFHEVK
jgi:hypothetical protein